MKIPAFRLSITTALQPWSRTARSRRRPRRNGFTRKKHDAGFPSHAIEYCLESAGIGLAEVDFVAFYDKPFLKFERLLETYLAFAPRGFRSFKMAIPLWLREKLFQKTLLRKEFERFDPGFD